MWRARTAWVAQKKKKQKARKFRSVYIIVQKFTASDKRFRRDLWQALSISESDVASQRSAFDFSLAVGIGPEIRWKTRDLTGNSFEFRMKT
jgi:hypothetical protein